MPNPVLERATRADDSAVRALLARVPMDGDVRLTFEREPDFALSASVEGDRNHTFVARDSSGAIVGLCSRAVRRVWADGRETRIGYLGQLRSAQPVAGRLRLLADGFAACHGTRQTDELPFDVTSIMADNTRARRLLERGLPSLPRYSPLATFLTFLFPKRQRLTPSDARLDLVAGETALAGRVAEFLKQEYRRFQLAPIWTESDLLSDETTRDLSMGDFVLALREDRIVGCAALWDQSRFRQTVVRGYSPRITRLRQLLNGWYGMTGSPKLPPVGTAVRMAAISHFAIEDDNPRIARALLGEIFRRAAPRDIDYLVLGVASSRPLSRFLETTFRSRILASQLYTVHYDGATPPELNGRIPHLEVATL